MITKTTIITTFLLQIISNTAFIPNIHYPTQKFAQSNNQNPLKASLQDTKDDIFAPLKRMFNFDNGSTTTKVEVNEYDEEIVEAKNLLEQAAETKSEDPELVIDALSNLERLMR